MAKNSPIKKKPVKLESDEQYRQPHDRARCWRVATLLALGWSVETVAEATGVSRTTIYTWRAQSWWADVVAEARKESPPAAILFEKAFRRVCHEIENTSSSMGAEAAMLVLQRLMPEMAEVPTAAPQSVTRLTVTLEHLGEGNALQLLDAVATATTPKQLPEDDT